MSLFHCRIFYCIAIFCGCILLYPTYGTVFLAICFSCLTLPLYRKFKNFGLKKIKKLPKNKHFLRLFYRAMPFHLYTFTLILSVSIPAAILGLLVAPQASLGLAQLKNMALIEKLNLLMPDNIKIFINTHLPSIKDYPAIESVINDIRCQTNLFHTALKAVDTSCITA